MLALLIELFQAHFGIYSLVKSAHVLAFVTFLLMQARVYLVPQRAILRACCFVVMNADVQFSAIRQQGLCGADMVSPVLPAVRAVRVCLSVG
jgi:glucan phosphoethanolaminetransferase (alkaline phosphatase superfamily)